MTEPPSRTFDKALLVRDTSAMRIWELDPGSSGVEFAVKHFWGLITIRGRFDVLAGVARVTAEGSVTASLSIDAGSIDTRQRKRDKHLRSADFFDVEHHPTIDVNAHAVRLVSGDAASVQADVVVAGAAATMECDVDIALSEGGHVAIVDTAVVADRTGFGLTRNPLHAAATTVNVVAHLVFRQIETDTTS